MSNSTEAPTQSPPRAIGVLVALLVILLVAGAFRFYNVNWDEGTYHIHPDERHTTMVVTAIQWPSSLGEYFDTSHSPLNPRNANTVFFYGTLPLFLTKAVATVLDRTGYDQVHLVGRVVSALFDLASVLLLFFMARRLFDWRVGLVASFLLALAALNIQGSHYFAVDTFLTFFVMLTLWFTLNVAEGKGFPSFVGLGISMGLTLACKVSVFLLVVVVALGAWFGLRRRVSRGEYPVRAALRTVLGLGVAALVAILIFRVAQPYAWAGPNYDAWDSVPAPWGERLRVLEKLPEPIRALAMPNPRWIADIMEAGAQQTGEADLPWGRQWTERTPWLYPLENMVLWGLGVPLGIAAWAGVALVIIRLVRAWRRRAAPSEPGPAVRWSLVVIPLAWVLLTFLWQGMQYVKSIRYFLPIYPYLAMFAGYLVISALEWARGRRFVARLAAGGLAAFVLLGTLAWAYAFIQIYTEPVTRVQATRWMYENVETAATLSYRTADGDTGQMHIATPPAHIYSEDGEWLVTPFVPPHDLTAAALAMNHLTGLEGPSEGVFRVAILGEDLAGDPLTEAQIEAVFGGDGGEGHLLDIPDVALSGGKTYYLQSGPVQGAPLLSEGAGIANEHFDDPLPFNMDGRLAFGSGPYQGLNLALYNEDTPEKLEELLDVLDEADYISMSSGRLHTSIPRLPMRYPVTTRYYELLFAEELGFEKAAEFHAYPRLFGIEFNDDRAEEQFTVYDHPKVLIYRKTGVYDRERTRTMLSEGIDWSGIAHWLNPRDVPDWRREHVREGREVAQQETIQDTKNDLMLTPSQWDVQVLGGTWASIFNRNSLANRWPTLSWLVLVGVLGLAALPLTVLVFRWLPDRGYILARPVGILLLAWLSWLLTNVSPLHYSRGTILLALGLICLASLASLLFPAQRRRFLDLWRTQKRLILVNELLFLAFFALFWLIRWGNPDLWHAWKGGEKPMDFAYLNAVIKSSEFPPYDPWFSGGYLNYYYFGQVMVGTLIKLAGIVPSVAYNLVIPLWFAMTAMGAFNVTYNLVRGSEGGRQHPLKPGRTIRAVLFGLVGALFVAVLGNLGQVQLILVKLTEGVGESFQSTIPGFAPLVRLILGTFEVAFGERALPIATGEWYWNASRAIPTGPYESVITEFPFFTFLYADLHAHLIALPLALLSLAAGLAVVRRVAGRGCGQPLSILPLLFLWALAIGAMRCTNTWDVPPHLLLALGALAIAAFSQLWQGWPGLVRRVGAVALQFGLVFVLSWLVLYWPFWANYGSYYNSLALWTGTRTQLWAYIVVHGLFLFVVISYLVVRVLEHGGALRPDPVLRRIRLTVCYRRRRRRLGHVARLLGVRGLPVSILVWLALAALILLELFFVIPGLISFTSAGREAVEAGAYAYRGLAVFGLGLPVAALGLLLLFRPRIPPVERFWAYLVLLGLAMTLGVEVIVIEGDVGRMNTVFKFYLQVWLLWGVAAAVALAWMVPRLRRWSQGRNLWLGILVLLLAGAALYPPLATSAKIRDRFEADLRPGLDGWEYMETASYFDPQGQEYELKWDLEAIQWLLDNVVGSPVVLEGHAPEYRWGARYAINTGLPTVLGWNWHQRQQRAVADPQEVWDRAHDVEAIYNSRIPSIAEPLLRKHDVRYIVVGPMERAYYAPEGLAKFEPMVGEGTLQAVFRNEGVTIYEVIR
jgi:YYY domain-containing protein